MKTTITINGITATCDSSVAGEVAAALAGVATATITVKATSVKTPVKTTSVKTPAKTTSVKTPVKTPRITPAAAYGIQWYDEFKSSVTTVTLQKTQVKVKVARGHADEWHDKLRAAGFTWSKKGFWWASLDDGTRRKVVERRAANEAATAGMSKEERRAYWRERTSH